uniref:Uncharacterized protein n=1 Tax=Romanomermis culicivorax TaxID=13658 RepID=A0A915HGD9_ROMCU
MFCVDIFFQPTDQLKCSISIVNKAYESFLIQLPEQIRVPRRTEVQPCDSDTLTPMSFATAVHEQQDDKSYEFDHGDYAKSHPQAQLTAHVGDEINQLKNKLQ